MDGGLLRESALPCSTPFAHGLGRLCLSRHPIHWQQTFSNITMKRRVRPVTRSSSPTMFYRIGVHVIHMLRQIAFITNRVFPITALPDAPLISFPPCCRPAFIFRQTFA